MTQPPDPYWDELGIAWCAIQPDIAVLMPRLQARLRRQSALIAASLFLGVPLAAAAFILGVWTIWSGWATGTWNFVTRGVTLVAISALLSMAVSSLLRVRASAGARALPEMIDLSIARAERTLKTIQLGFYACAVAAVLGLLGTAIRTHLSRPPALPPAVDLAVLATFALGLFLYGRRARVTLAKFRYLKLALAPETEGK
jgi:hypothetical protein